MNSFDVFVIKGFTVLKKYSANSVQLFGQLSYTYTANIANI